MSARKMAGHQFNTGRQIVELARHLDRGYSVYGHTSVPSMNWFVRFSGVRCWLRGRTVLGATLFSARPIQGVRRRSN